MQKNYRSLFIAFGNTISSLFRGPSFSLLLTLLAGTVQAQDLAWANHAPASVFPLGSSDVGRATAIDAFGNVLVTGAFSNTADFDPGANTANLTSNGNEDIFVAKYNSSGEYLWAFNIGSSGYARGQSIVVDGSGDVLVTGHFQGTADFDPGTSAANLTSVGNYDIFVAKYSTNGEYLWSFKIGGTNGDFVHGIVMDGSGNVLVTGAFSNTADFDPGANTANLTSNGSEDIFVAKYNSSGEYLWAFNIGSSGYAQGQSIVVDDNGNVLVTGGFQGTADFDPGASTANLTSIIGTYDIFVAKYNTNGEYQWAFNIGGIGSESGRDISVDDSGNVLVTGSFQGTADFDPGTNASNLTSSGPNDIFVAKYNSSGEYLWAFKIGGTGYDHGAGITVDGIGNVLVTGYFQGTADFDPGANASNLTSSGTYDIFVAKYNANGEYQWAFKIGGVSNDFVGRIATDGNGNVLVAGYFYGTADFDPGAGTSNLTAGSGTNDAFIAKYSSAGAYLWAGQIGLYSNSSAPDYNTAIAHDNMGNTFITGLFQGTADFDPSANTASGYFDIFVAKYNANGEYQWAFKIGGADDDRGQGIAVDGSGNVLVTGYFQGTADFDPGANTATLTSSGSSDIFVAKYNANGEYQWAFNIGGAGPDQGQGIAVDGSGNVLVTGSFYYTSDFDPGANTATLTSSGSHDIFVAKYNANGEYQWAFNIGGTGSDLGEGIAVDGSGNVLVTGYFSGTADFDPSANTATLTSSGYFDIFVAKYNANGEYQWAFKIGGADDDRGQGIAVDGSGNVLVTGYFQGTADFDPGANTATLTSSGSSDIFVAKYNANGEYQWAFNIGGAGPDQGQGIAVDGSGNVLVTGYFQGTADFAPGANTANLTSSGNHDIFIAKYNVGGEYQWAFSIGGTSSDVGQGIAVDGSGNVMVTGYFGGTADFDPGTGTTNLTSVNSVDGFLAKYSTCQPQNWYADNDNDGYGNGSPVNACTSPGSNYASQNGDCDDADNARFPGNPEICDGKDNDCADGIPANEADADNDGYRVCQNDCDDADPLTHPGALDICDGLDSDCDGQAETPPASPLIAWQNTIGGSGYDQLNSMRPTTDGGYILGGFSNSGANGDKTEGTNGGNDYWVVKTDANGNIQWQNTIGGSSDDDLAEVRQTSDGGYFVAGSSQSGVSGDKTEGNFGLRDYWVLKLNATGGIEWQKTIGGNNTDFLEDVQQTSDGGYILMGNSISPASGIKSEGTNGAYDYWVVKLNSTGSIEWQNTIGGSGDDGGNTVLQTPDGGYLLGGYSISGANGDKTEGSNGGHDYWVLKLNSTGDIVWQNTIGSSGTDEFTNMALTSNGGSILIGSSGGGVSGDKTEASLGGDDYWVVKLNPNGAIEWQNTIGGSGGEQPRSVQQITGGGYFIAGYSVSGISGDKTEASRGSTDWWAMWLDAAGNLISQKTIGGSGAEAPLSSCQNTDGSYLLAGYSDSNISGEKTENNLGSLDFWIVKLALDDADGDGYATCDDDCDDTDANVNPAATEICNLIDDDCDGNIDEGVQSTFYADTDGDTYGDAGSTTQACTAPSGFVANDDDCDDSDANVNPAATEVCNLIDDNCDGNIDEGVQSTFFADTDGDTYGDAGSTTLACTAPSGFVANDDDCDDTNANVNPAATEICNLIDDDCDGNIDEGTQSTFYADTDGDTYGDAGSTTQACTAPSGFVANDDDCDDSDANVNPAATEICNLIDDDCDGNIDEGVQSTFYADTDGDTYGDAGSTTQACTAPSGFVANDDDCDDSDANVNPAATEICNLIDDDCDGNIDEGVQSTFYADTDGDTYGDAGSTTQACTAPSGFVANDDDCDDSNANVNPAATEICNGIDDNCDGSIDEGTQSTFYADTDGDTYGDAASTTQACTAPSGFVANDDDCDDTNANVNPAATEICNGIDDNCDGNIDEETIPPTAVCKNATAILDANGMAMLLPASVNGGSSDNCTPPGGLSLAASPNVFGCADAGGQTVTLTATDDAGNTASCVATVTVLDVLHYMQETQRTASDGLANDNLGWGAGLDGQVLIAGAPNDKVGTQSKQGSAYVFLQNQGGADNWGQLKQIKASDGAAVDYFGNSIAIADGIALVAAHGDNVGTITDAGSVYIFEKDLGGLSNWGQRTSLVASDATAYDYFGSAASLENGRAIIGAPKKKIGANNAQGAAYIHEKDAGGPDNWGNLKKIIASDGAANNFFGQSVAQSDGLVLVGANGHSNNRGAAYLFSKDLGGTDNWGQAQKLTASDAVVGDGFGTSVSMSSTVALIGAPSQAAYKGAAYIFKNSGGTWAEAKKLTASDGAANDRFGTAVAVSGDYAYVAALRASGNAGAVYVFHKDAGGTDKWGQIGKYAPAAGEAGDQFGCSLAVSGERMALGANMDDVDGKANQGSVYVLKGEDCPDLPRPASTPTIARSASALTDVRCRPNPFADELTLTVENVLEESLRVQITDLTGHLVLEKTWPTGTQALDIESLGWPSGLYLVCVNGADGAARQVLRAVKME